MENSSCYKDKGLAPKKGRTSSNVHHRIVSQGFGFCLGLCYQLSVWPWAHHLGQQLLTHPKVAT